MEITQLSRQNVIRAILQILLLRHNILRKVIRIIALQVSAIRLQVGVPPSTIRLNFLSETEQNIVRDDGTFAAIVIRMQIILQYLLVQHLAIRRRR